MPIELLEKKQEKSCPIHLVSKGGLENVGLDAAAKAWADHNGFSGDAGRVLILPGAGGEIGGALFGLGKAKGAFHAEWETAPPWLPGEPWPRFVARSTDQAAREIRALDARIDAPSARYFVAVLPEDRYPHYLRRR